MSTSSRLTEKWINRGLWVVAFVFAAFLIGLGKLVVQDLPQVQTSPEMINFVDKTKHAQLKKTIEVQRNILTESQTEVQKENDKLYKLQDKYAQSKLAYENWLSARATTQDQNQNSEILSRTKDLDHQQNLINNQQKQIEIKTEESHRLEQDLAKSENELQNLESVAYAQVDHVNKVNQIKVFIYRLGITLPLLLIGAWLFIKKRKSQHWPFVWGFIIFSLFVFFIELVPYLPSYGGYIRYIVGIIMTFFVGHYAIRALQNYLEKQKQAESMPNSALKGKLNYDLAQQRLSRSICPGCERPVDLKDESKNFCIHCGTGLFNKCTKCHSRKNAFAKYCHSCGEVAV